jgi:cytochrome c-type biogenesis protein CcsB
LTSSLATQNLAVDTVAPLSIGTSDLGQTAVLELPTMAATAALTPQRLSLADTLDNISYRIIGLGFPLLTIGIIAGGVWANEAWGSYWSWDPKETWALILWLVFAAYLHSRITKGWQGRKPAILATVGFAIVWICYLGVNLLGKGLHSYGWFM